MIAALYFAIGLVVAMYFAYCGVEKDQSDVEIGAKVLGLTIMWPFALIVFGLALVAEVVGRAVRRLVR